MDAILVVNAGSSSVKFEVFAVAISTGSFKPYIKGQMDGAETRPRLCAAGRDGVSLVDQTFSPKDVSGMPAAVHSAAEWLGRQIID
jgi:acetate kinase